MFTPLKLLSIFVCLLLMVGVVNRRRKRVHIPIMVSAFLIDMTMLLYIEITRHAIETVVKSTTTLMKIHVTVSVVVVVLYLGQMVSGIRKAKGRGSAWHGKGGVALLLFRLGNLITSFLLPL